MLEGLTSGVPNPRQLTEHARGLAGSHRKRLTKLGRARSLVPLMDEAADGLRNGYDELARAALQSLQAGADLLLICHDHAKVRKTYRTVIDSVAKGILTANRLRKSIARIAEVRRKFTQEMAGA